MIPNGTEIRTKSRMSSVSSFRPFRLASALVRKIATTMAMTYIRP